MVSWGSKARVHAIGLALVGLGVVSLAASAPPKQSTPRVVVNGRISFQREVPVGDHTQTDIYTVHPDGTGVVRLTVTPNRNEFGPAWDPAGNLIAFWRTPAPFGTGSLWVMDGDGTNQQRLTAGVDARDPSWNPDGTRLVYDLATNDLYSLRVSDGQDRQQLTSGPAFDFEPAWSPDGNSIAFTRGTATGDPGDIFLLDLTSQTVSRLTHSPAYDHQVSWGPAGNRVVFERDFGNRSAIFTVKRDGTGLQPLTTGTHFDIGPTYSADAQYVAFGSDRATSLGDLWVMDKNGANSHQLLTLTFAEGNPAWQAAAS